MTKLINLVSVRTYNILYLAGIKSVEDLKNSQLTDIMKLKNVRLKTMVEIIDVLESNGNSVPNISKMIVADRFGYKLCGDY